RPFASRAVIVVSGGGPVGRGCGSVVPVVQPASTNSTAKLATARERRFAEPTCKSVRSINQAFNDINTLTVRLPRELQRPAAAILPERHRPTHRASGTAQRGRRTEPPATQNVELGQRRMVEGRQGPPATRRARFRPSGRSIGR